MNKEQAKELIEKYDKGLATAHERALLNNWFLYESRKSGFPDNDGKFLLLKSDIWQATLQQAGLKPKSVSRKMNLWSGIAAAIAFIGIATVLFVYVSSDSAITVSNSFANDVPPGGNKAVLTLANGQKISLTDAQNGNLLSQAGLRVTKLADGQIVYESIASDDGETINQSNVQENTITTPKGGKYAIILPDGTKVILNAASALTFPTAFVGSEREVRLEGEAYFEVSKNKEHPFKVNSGIQTIEVLGTHFNVNAYVDERAIKTTLVEGSVKVSVGSFSTIIVPGQQAVVSRENTEGIEKSFVEIDKDIAWKNDILSFEQDNVASVMRKISRWYDVAVEYNGEFPDERFFGEISRKSNLSEVAKILELNNIHLEIKGKTVKVSYNQVFPGRSQLKK